MPTVRTVLSHLAVLALALVIFVVQGPSRYILHAGDQLGDEGDSVLNAWILAWDAQALPDLNRSVWDAPIFYPVKDTLAFSETMFGNLWITWPVQYVTGNPILAFNALVIVSFILAMYCTFLLVRRLTGSYPAAVIAGIVFAFNPLRWSEIDHVQLMPFFWAPLALLGCYDFHETLRWRGFALMVLALVAQAYASIYLGIILFMTLLIFGGGFLFLERRRGERLAWLLDRRVVIPSVVGAAVGVAALMPLMPPYWRSAETWNFVRSESDNACFSCELLSFFVPNFTFATYRAWNVLCAFHIRWCYGLGIVPVGLAFAAVFFARRTPQAYTEQQRRALWRFTWTALACAILMLGPYLIVLDHKTDIPLPYLAVYYLVPGAKAMRVPTRYVFPLLLCLSVLAGFAVARLIEIAKHWRPSFRVALAVAALGIAIIDYRVGELPPVRYEPMSEFPPVYRYLAEDAEQGPVLELPAIWQHQFRYQYYQTAHWRPLVGGETGSYPPALLDMTKRLLQPPTDATLRFVHLTPAQTVVIHLAQISGAMREAWEKANLAAHGFRLAARLGDDVVWERVEPSRPFSGKLRIVRVTPKFEKGFFRDSLAITAEVAPCQDGSAWRYLSSAVTTLDFIIADAAGREHRFQKTIDVPSYLLAGETTGLRIGRVRGVPKEIRSIRISGPLIEDYTETMPTTEIAGR